PVVLVVVDTVRADHFSSYGYRRPTTPKLDAWAKKGVRFEHAYATSPWTVPSFTSVMTGLWPTKHRAGFPFIQNGQKFFVGLTAEATTLGEQLKEVGYDTGGFVTNGSLAPNYGLSRGIDDYDYFAASQWTLRPAREIVDLALGWIDAREKPYLAVLHFFEPHLIYDPPKE
ncbi:MAG: sulfatase-like hydrolase/transferase, partial [bacterium]|nr:sulfatase-like hydrolase/transferase [bacterium]